MTERVAMTIRLPEELKEQLQRKAEAWHMAFHDLVLLILWEAN